MYPLCLKMSKTCTDRHDFMSRLPTRSTPYLNYNNHNFILLSLFDYQTWASPDVNCQPVTTRHTSNTKLMRCTGQNLHQSLRHMHILTPRGQEHLLEQCLNAGCVTNCMLHPYSDWHVLVASQLEEEAFGSWLRLLTLSRGVIKIWPKPLWWAKCFVN